MRREGRSPVHDTIPIPHRCSARCPLRIPPSSTIRSPRRPRPARPRSRARRSTGCACRCRSRSTTSTCGCSRTATAGRSSTPAIGNAPTRALWERHFAQTLGGKPVTRIIATHYHPDHVGNAAWLAERFGCPRDDDAGRVPDRARDRATSARRTARPTPASCSACTAWRADDVARAWRRAATATARWCPSFPPSFDRILEGDTRRAGGTRLARHRRPRPFARAPVALLRGRSTC